MAASAVSLVVPGDPVPLERARSGKGFTYTPPRSRAYKTLVGAHARRANLRPLAGPVHVRLDFFRATSRRCDWDNLAKSICDALNGIAWRDDSQIVLALVTKSVDRSNPRVEIAIQEITE